MNKSPCILCRNLLAMPWAAVVLLLAGAGALITAYTAQYLFGVQACDLCYLERIPYGVAVVLSILALMARPYGRVARILISLCAVTFLVSTGQAIFHHGVEQHWWADLAGCALEFLDANDAAGLREQLLAKTNVPCDQVTWSFLGVSMVTWNIFFSLAMAIFAEEAARRGLNPEGVSCCCCCKTREPKA